MDLSQALSDRTEIEVPFGENRLKVVYNPQKATPELQHRMVRNPGEEVAGDIEAQALSELLVSWDLTSGKQKVGIDRDSLRKLPMQILDRVLAAIFEDMATSRDSPGATRST